MHSHANACLTARGRAKVFEAVDAGLTVSAACRRFNVTRRWYYEWLPRWRSDGLKGMEDRSTKPKLSPQQLSLDREKDVAVLRKITGWGPDRISAVLGIPRSTTHRSITRLGLCRSKKPREAVHRYEYATPGAMLHADTKKLGRIRGLGHRMNGDRRTRNRGIGWEVMHMVIDDATRLAYTEVLPDEKGRTTALFLARAVRWYREQGIDCDRILTDNGSPDRSKAWRRVCRAAGLRHRFTRPYRPQTNGKAERWIQAALRECLYLWPFLSSGQRERDLQMWTTWYNDQRPHLGLKGSSPRRRLRELLAQRSVTNVVGVQT